MVVIREEGNKVGLGGLVGPRTPPRQHPSEVLGWKRAVVEVEEQEDHSPAPRKSIKTSRLSSPGMVQGGLPVIRCPCGGGACPVLTSGSLRNPGRRYYACPLKHRSGCNFFKWCDEVVKHDVPPCPCGAGTSSLNRHLSGPDVGRWYFACRIKKNHGACTFYQTVESELNSLLNKFLPRIMADSSLPCSSSSQLTSTARNEDSRKEEERRFKLPVMQNSVYVEITDQDLIMKEAESLVPLTTNAHRTCQLIVCQSEIHVQQMRFQKEVFAAEIFGHLLGMKFQGWLGRLAFTPARPLKDPPALSIFWCVFPSFYPIPLLEDEPLADDEEISMTTYDSSNNGTQMQPAPQQTDLPLSNMLLEPCKVESLSTSQDENTLSAVVLKSFGPGFLRFLQSMQVPDHGKMLEVAESTLDSWRQVGVDCGPFSEGVKDYIRHISRLADMEGSVSEGLSSRKLAEVFSDKKAGFDHACKLHKEMVANLEASEKQVKSLRDEASSLRDVLMRLEKQIAECEAWNLKLKKGVADKCKEKIEAEGEMRAASLMLRQVLEVEQQREGEIAAANAVMERLRGLLQERHIMCWDTFV